MREAPFDPGSLPPGLTCEPLNLGGRPLPSYLVRFEQGVAVFDIGVPLLQDGTFMSHAFAHLKYPERYVHLFSEESGNAIKTAANNAHHIANAYVTLVRPPFLSLAYGYHPAPLRRFPPGPYGISDSHRS